jgi:hypothetical protein
MNQERRRRRRRLVSLCLCFLGGFPRGTDLFAFVNQSLDLGWHSGLGSSSSSANICEYQTIKQQDLVNSSCISYKYPQLHEIDFLESHAVKKTLLSSHYY